MLRDQTQQTSLWWFFLMGIDCVNFARQVADSKLINAVCFNKYSLLTPWLMCYGQINGDVKQFCFHSFNFGYCFLYGSRNLQVIASARNAILDQKKKTLLGCCWLADNLAGVKMFLALNFGRRIISYRKCVSLRRRVVLLAVSAINGL